jgi:hypothetical protein
MALIINIQCTQQEGDQWARFVLKYRERLATCVRFTILVGLSSGMKFTQRPDTIYINDEHTFFGLFFSILTPLFIHIQVSCDYRWMLPGNVVLFHDI